MATPLASPLSTLPEERDGVGGYLGLQSVVSPLSYLLELKYRFSASFKGLKAFLPASGPILLTDARLPHRRGCDVRRHWHQNRLHGLTHILFYLFLYTRSRLVTELIFERNTQLTLSPVLTSARSIPHFRVNKKMKILQVHPVDQIKCLAIHIVQAYCMYYFLTSKSNMFWGN